MVWTYSNILGTAVNAVVLSQVGLSVNDINSLRKGLKKVNGQIMIVKKRLLLKSLPSTDVEAIEHSQLPGSLVLLISKDEVSPFAPLKAVNDFVKEGKKDGLKFKVNYVWGWIERVWKPTEYVTELANLPSKEELISKLLYLMKHPAGSFARVINEVAKTKA